METILAILVGALYAGGVYLVLRRSVVKLLIGLAILSHAANLLIFTAGGLTPRAKPPLVAEEHPPDAAGPAPAIKPPSGAAIDPADPVEPHPEPAGVARPADEASPRAPPATADPLPQALILTAIVISFAVLAFSLALMQRAYQAVGTDDLDRLNTTDR
ncbi:MAG: NADH-quinone oxidoreductase subunit K [Planctomycetales bacterium]